MTFESALSIVNLLIFRGIPREEAITNPAVPNDFRNPIRERLEDRRTQIGESCSRESGAANDRTDAVGGCAEPES
jgi:hypothetical protein